MADEQDVLLQFWQEQRNQARQSENQRAAMTNIILIVASAAIGLVAHQGTHDRSMLAVTVGLMLLGIYGTVGTMKYHERFAMHMEEAKSLRRRLDTLQPALALEDDRRDARNRHSHEHPVLYRIRLHYIWATLHASIALTGAVITAVIIAE